MSQIDFVGDLPPPRPFKDIRNTRSSTAEEKAQLFLELGRLCLVVPQSVRDGSVNITRQWRASQEAGRKTCANSRSSVTDLSVAIKNLRAYT